MDSIKLKYRIETLDKIIGECDLELVRWKEIRSNFVKDHKCQRVQDSHNKNLALIRKLVLKEGGF